MVVTRKTRSSYCFGYYFITETKNLMFLSGVISGAILVIFLMICEFRVLDGNWLDPLILCITKASNPNKPCHHKMCIPALPKKTESYIKFEKITQRYGMFWLEVTVALWCSASGIWLGGIILLLFPVIKLKFDHKYLLKICPLELVWDWVIWMIESQVHFTYSHGILCSWFLYC